MSETVTSTPFGALRQVDATPLLASASYRVIVPLDAGAYAGKFPGKYEHRMVEAGIGHNLPQEAPHAFAQAVIDVAGF